MVCCMQKWYHVGMETITGTQTDSALKPQQVADRLGISRRKVYRMLDSGDLPGFRVGSARRVRASDVQEYIEERIEHGSR